MLFKFACSLAIALLTSPFLWSQESLNLLPTVVRLRAEQGATAQRRLAVTGTAGISGLSLSWSGGKWFYGILSTTKVPGYVAVSANARSLAPGVYTGQMTLRSSKPAMNNPQTIRVELEVVPPAAAYPLAVFRDSLNVIRVAEYGLPPGSSGAAFASDPGAAQARSGETFVAARAADNSLWANVYFPASKTWSQWQSGGGAIQGRPSVAVVSASQSYIAARDPWGSVWLKPFSRLTGFGSWLALGGTLGSDPAATACADGAVYIAGRDPSTGIWIGRYSPASGFSGWMSLGTGFQGSPAVACGTDNAAYVVARDTSSVLKLARVEGASWAWHPSTGVTAASDPKVVVTGTGSVFAIVQDAAQTVWFRPFIEGTGSNWVQWMNSRGAVQSFSGAGVRGLLYIVGRNASSQLVWYRSSPGTWSAPVSGAVATGSPSAAPF
jgi:hypothetical protein